MSKKPYVLCILDGWGEGEPSDHNAITLAESPNWDRLRSKYPFTTLDASEHEVGLPDGQMGNSEVGHTNIGAGRVVLQDLPRIDQAIAQNQLSENLNLNAFIKSLGDGATCHLMGLLSPGGVHSHQDHIVALAEILDKAGINTVFHVFLDGRDTPPQSGYGYMEEFLSQTTHLKHFSIGTVAGRYYAMDRDKRWDRIEKAYRAIVQGEGHMVSSPLDAIQASYDAGVNDEFMIPAVIGGYKGMGSGDGVLMANFRSDRVRQLLTTFVDSKFNAFGTKSIKLGSVIGLTEYSSALKPHMKSLFPPEELTNSVGEVISNQGLTQLRIAETEKYAHVTFFLNGGREEPFKGEERILVPSPKVATYDQQPEMSAYEMTDKLVEEINSGAHDFITVNYANTDMVGHTGNIEASVKAVEVVDECLGKLYEAVLAKQGVLCITADHGNIEALYNEQNQSPHTAHTCNSVPFIIIGENLTFQKLRLGKLADIAPTLLGIMGLKTPIEMTGQSLVITESKGKQNEKAS